MNTAADIEVLYEDGDVLVINKPVGILVHDDGRGRQGPEAPAAPDQPRTPTVVDWFLEHYPDAKGLGEPANAPDGTPLERSGVVHRLDRDTSGVLILAKHQDAFVHLKAQFHDRLVEKEYRAIVHGNMNEVEAVIRKPIGRSPSDFRKRSATAGARGVMRDAVTKWQLVENFEKSDHKFAHVALWPKTGRTHQLRVHLKAIDRPIVGDALYTPASLRSAGSAALNTDRMLLHAHRLTIALPGTPAETMTFESPLPAEFCG